MIINKDIVIIGGGPAGLAAAAKLWEIGVKDIVIIEREKQLGGILRQCIHDGFGLARFKENLSGPEYAQKFIDIVSNEQIPFLLETSVININSDKLVTAVSAKQGMVKYQAKAVILAMGCRERTRGAISLPGTRPSGIMTAGVAQSYMNLYNRMVGNKIVILGSGDIGMIMARRLTLEGAKVDAVIELMPYASGLPRNIQQCLNDYDIPLYLSHTVVEILGNNRLSGIVMAQVNNDLTPIPGTEKSIDCDTLILSVGLIPENELSLGAGVVLDPRTKGAIITGEYQTNIDGIFVAGNVLHVHDLVDFVSKEAENTAEAVARYLNNFKDSNNLVDIIYDSNIGYVVPQKVFPNKDFTLSLRVRSPKKNCILEISQDGKPILSKKFAKAIPAEMIQISIKSEILSNNSKLEVTIK